MPSLLLFYVFARACEAGTIATQPHTLPLLREAVPAILAIILGFAGCANATRWSWTGVETDEIISTNKVKWKRGDPPNRVGGKGDDP